jgi:hypothetical protein
MPGERTLERSVPEGQDEDTTRRLSTAQDLKGAHGQPIIPCPTGRNLGLNCFQALRAGLPSFNPYGMIRSYGKLAR